MASRALAAASLWLAACAQSAPETVGSSSEGLVFVRVVEGSFDLARARIADGAVRSLTRTPEREESWPYWSDIAGRIVFQVHPANTRGPDDLALWEAESGEEHLLTESPRRDERWPAWSPTEEKLVYAVRGQQSGIALVDLAKDPTTARPLASAAAGESLLRPVFSPDGAQWVVQRRSEQGRHSSLWLLSENSAPRELAADPESFQLKGRFTRDGSRVVFTRRPKGGGPHEIASVNLSGEEFRLHAGDGSDDHSAQPSPTRDEIAFISDRDGQPDVFLASLAGGDTRNLTHSPQRHEFAPRWSPNGEFLVVTTAEAELGQPRLNDRSKLEHSRIRVFDREGQLLLDELGFMADWMPAW